MKLSNQYLSFLGGEVSESLWYRTDMDKFNKWFANAENIRFTTMGSFSNRPGFKRLGPVLKHQLKPVVKLIPFVFNNEEVFEIEFVTGKFRVRKNGEVLVRDDGSEVVYDSPIKIESLQQLKYAQSGDIIFIASGTSPIMELRRLKTDGTKWELVQFKSELPPVGEENDDKEKTIQISELPSDIGVAKTYDTEGLFYQPNSYFLRFSNSTHAITGSTIDEVVENANSKLTSLRLAKINDTSFEVTPLSYPYSTEISQFYADKTYGEEQQMEGAVGTDYLDFLIPKGWELCGLKKRREVSELRLVDTKGDFLRNEIEEHYDIHQVWVPSVNPVDFIKMTEPIISKAVCHTKNNQWYLRIFPKYSTSKSTAPGYRLHYEEYYTPIFGAISHKTTELLFNVKQEIKNPYLLTQIGGRVYKKNDVVCLKNSINSGQIKLTQGKTDSFNSEEIIGFNKWRYYTSGNWKGEINIYYSNDSGETWKKLRTSVSNQTAEPGIFNENTSGTIEGAEVLKFKISGKIEDGSVNINFYTDSFDVNSYYKVIEKYIDGKYIVSCVKNDVGYIEGTHKWRDSVFSDDLGYPESIGFYQNRLFLGKGYELWGSKLNDYWDFYEPMDLKKEDPINISILTYKVNTIKNILTTKSFFVFTTGGEFGIASQGAISQDDKFLKQFSSHGSNDCQPLIVGNLVVFVDSTGNTVRAFQYSFESDSYEANDITIFIEEKLRGKNIITTEYIKSTKECLFLDSDGVIWVFKYMPEQNIMAWSHWKHGQYKITNLCVSPRGAYDDLYVVVDAPDGKFVEKLDESIYSDSVEEYLFEEPVVEVQTQLVDGKVVNVDDSINNKYKATVDEFGKVKLRSPSANVKIGLSYNSTATLLTPTISLQDGTYTTFRKQKLNKAYFIYKDSFGFRVGEENSEKMEIDFQSPADSIESQVNLSSGKKSVLIPNTYDGTARLSFVQDEPYPMKIVNVLLESDYGGQ